MSFLDRLFKENAFLRKFSDENRLSRLEDCNKLQEALEICEKSHLGATTRHRGSWRRGFGGEENNPVLSEVDLEKAQSESIERIQNIRGGMKIARFFEWGLQNPNASAAIDSMRKQEIGTKQRTMHPSNSSNSEWEEPTLHDMDKKANVTSQVPCSMERHAVWACRSLAVGCASDLSDLKRCFKEKLGTTNPSANHYEDSAVDIDKKGAHNDNAGCKWNQRKLGNCVIRETDELEKRVKQM